MRRRCSGVSRLRMRPLPFHIPDRIGQVVQPDAAKAGVAERPLGRGNHLQTYAAKNGQPRVRPFAENIHMHMMPRYAHERDKEHPPDAAFKKAFAQGDGTGAAQKRSDRRIRQQARNNAFKGEIKGLPLVVGSVAYQKHAVLFPAFGRNVPGQCLGRPLQIGRRMQQRRADADVRKPLARMPHRLGLPDGPFVLHARHGMQRLHRHMAEAVVDHLRKRLAHGIARQAAFAQFRADSVRGERPADLQVREAAPDLVLESVIEAVCPLQGAAERGQEHAAPSCSRLGSAGRSAMMRMVMSMVAMVMMVMMLMVVKIVVVKTMFMAPMFMLIVPMVIMPMARMFMARMFMAAVGVVRALGIVSPVMVPAVSGRLGAASIVMHGVLLPYDSGCFRTPARPSAQFPVIKSNKFSLFSVEHIPLSGNVKIQSTDVDARPAGPGRKTGNPPRKDVKASRRFLTCRRSCSMKPVCLRAITPPTQQPECESMSNYKKTLQLPKTGFPMKANLKQKEPETLKFWAENNVYDKMVAKREGEKRYILHDGPPYANGHLHMGHALNKIIKDIIVKSKSMAGFQAPYVPGWDCHGLPIEHKVSQELKKKGKENLPPLVVRRLCREYAAKFVKIQRREFERLGVFGEWDKPYLTMHPSYETATAGVLCDFVENGAVYRGKKPIHWCTDCKTALAEAEVEYADETSPSIYVRFPILDDNLAETLPKAEPGRTFAAIWTTTPWTIPSNMAVAAHPEFEYALVREAGDYYLLAKELLAACKEKFGWEEAEIVSEHTGADLEGLTAKHPFYDRPSPLVTADYVTLDTGTGLVHTAPGHGREDYETGLRCGLDILSPIADDGRFLDVVEFFAGKTIYEANPLVIDKIEETGNLLAQEKIRHSYPHCWRCKKPVIFRATTQWFISMEKNDLRKKALAAIENDVAWFPAWGRERIYGMIEQRPDWCISRQRNWGVPIVALICKSCNAAYNDPDWMRSVVAEFENHEHGCDYWFEAPVEKVVPQGLTCPECGGTHFEKEFDILDVWFDSGTSFAAVCEKRDECDYPADMYLEGSDQHRGWFHSSLLASMGTRGRAPYREVLTHGYTVDSEGKKMSKSVGNVILPEEVIKKYGAEILRIWTATVNYQDDVRISDEILDRQVEAYRRIRNTCRFILGNIRDFRPDEHALAPADMLPLDRFALDMATRSHDRMQKAYARYEFHKVFHGIHNLCVTDLSAFYLDILKDRLYVSGENSKERRSAQTALWRILLLLLADMAPILSFTAEEVFQYTPEDQRGPGDTVFELSVVPEDDWRMPEELRQTMEFIVDLRGEVTKAIEPRRKAGDIGHSLDTVVTLHLTKGRRDELEALSGVDLREIFIVSGVVPADFDDAPDDAYASDAVEKLAVAVDKAGGAKCGRCWVYSEDLGTNPDHPDVCPRCAAVLAGIEASEG